MREQEPGISILAASSHPQNSLCPGHFAATESGHEGPPCPGAGTAPLHSTPWNAGAGIPSLEFLLPPPCCTWLNGRPNSIPQPFLLIPPWVFLLLKSLLISLDQSCPGDPQDHIWSIQGCSGHRFSTGKPSCRLSFAVDGAKQVTVLYHLCCILWGKTWGFSQEATEIAKNS